jgi:hypothetical protein
MFTYLISFISQLNCKDCLLSGLTQRSPTISYITQTQIKDIGGTVELSCSVQYTNDYPVIWMKIDPRSNANSLPISTGSSLILHESRYSLRYDTVSRVSPFISDNSTRSVVVSEGEGKRVVTVGTV